MTLTSLDQIVKNILLKRGYSYHWYLDFLVYCKDIMREIAFDSPIFSIRYIALPVNQDDNTIELPNDYQDYTRVSAWVDGYLRPLVENNNLQLIPNYDDDFALQPYSDGIAIATAQQQNLMYSNNLLTPYWYMVNWNNFGENTGRLFGGIGGYVDGFRVDKSRNIIKIDDNLFIEYVALEYISDGMDSDSATKIDAYAQMAIEAGAIWQHKEHNRTYGAGEAAAAKAEYELEVVRLRARLSDLTIDKLKRAVQSNNIRIKY
jgi:hypothetical protein